MSEVFDWQSAELRWTGGGEHELEVAHRLRTRAARHLDRALIDWQDSHGLHLRFHVQAATGDLDEPCSGSLTCRGALLRVSAPELREVLDELASAALVKGEREDREDGERIDAWLQRLRGGT